MALLQTVEELKKTQTTVVIITHRPSILKATNKVLVMNSGKIERYGNTQDILGAISTVNGQAQQQRVGHQSRPQINLTKPGS